jgi:predicted RND superfamily exporter protein
MLIASIVIGLAVDDTIHFMYNFRRYYQKTGDLNVAVENTLMTAGRAMLTTSVVLSLGFFIFMFAEMNIFFYFGLLAGSAVLLALGADLLLAPALMTLVIKKEKSGQLLDPS